MPIQKRTPPSSGCTPEGGLIDPVAEAGIGAGQVVDIVAIGKVDALHVGERVGTAARLFDGDRAVAIEGLGIVGAFAVIDDGIVARSAIDQIGPAGAVDRVVAGQGQYCVVKGGSVETIPDRGVPTIGPACCTEMSKLSS